MTVVCVGRYIGRDMLTTGGYCATVNASCWFAGKVDNESCRNDVIPDAETDGTGVIGDTMGSATSGNKELADIDMKGLAVLGKFDKFGTEDMAVNAAILPLGTLEDEYC